MKSKWSIDEILIRLPIVNIKLKAARIESAEARKETERTVLAETHVGMKIGLKSFNGSFVGADINRNGKLMANGPKMDAWETFELFRLPDGKVSLRSGYGLRESAGTNL